MIGSPGLVSAVGTCSGESAGREGLGRGYDRGGSLARGEGVRYEDWDYQPGAARFTENLCQALPCGWRRTGADPVSVGPRFSPDDGALPGLQAADPVRRQ